MDQRVGAQGSWRRDDHDQDGALCSAGAAGGISQRSVEVGVVVDVDEKRWTAYEARMSIGSGCGVGWMQHVCSVRPGADRRGLRGVEVSLGRGDRHGHPAGHRWRCRTDGGGYVRYSPLDASYAIRGSYVNEPYALACSLAGGGNAGYTICRHAIGQAGGFDG